MISESAVSLQRFKTCETYENYNAKLIPMSVNKNIFNRLKVYDSCFHNVEGSTKEVIMEKLSAADRAATDIKDKKDNEKGFVINDRQFYNDLKTIETFWMIKIDRKKNGKTCTYKYKQPGYTIFPDPTDDELLYQIRKNLSYFRQFKGLPTLKFLDYLMALTRNEEADFSTPKIIVEFDGNPDLMGIDHFPTLLEAIQEEKILKINYYKSYNTMEEYKFCPYFLKQFNSRWFVLGTNIQYPNSISSLAIDRINNIENVEDESYIETHVDFDKEYFENVIGPTIPRKCEVLKVKLRFSKERFDYIVSKPIHLSQKDYKKERTITMEVMHNRELESLILYFGDDVEVLEPENLRTVIKNRIDQMYKKYHLIKETEIEVVK